jgi:hypothetical protein
LMVPFLAAHNCTIDGPSVAESRRFCDRRMQAPLGELTIIKKDPAIMMWIRMAPMPPWHAARRLNSS